MSRPDGWITKAPGIRIRAYVLRGGVRREQGNYTEAIKDSTRAIELDTRSFAAYNNRASAYIAQTEYEKGIGDFKVVIRLCQVDIHNPEMRYHLVSAHHQLGAVLRELTGERVENRRELAGDAVEYRVAIEHLNRAIELDPKCYDAYNNRGAAHKELRNYGQAISDYRDALRLHDNYQDYPNVYTNLVEILSFCPDPGFCRIPEAIELAKTACRLTKGRDQNARILLAKAYRAAGDTPKDASRNVEDFCKELPR